MSITELVNIINAFAQVGPFTAIVIALIIAYVKYPAWVAANNSRDQLRANIEGAKAKQEQALVEAIEKAFITINESLARSAGQDYQMRNLMSDYNNLGETVKLLQQQLVECRKQLADCVDVAVSVSTSKARSSSKRRTDPGKMKAIQNLAKG